MVFLRRIGKHLFQNIRQIILISIAFLQHIIILKKKLCCLLQLCHVIADDCIAPGGSGGNALSRTRIDIGFRCSLSQHIQRSLVDGIFQNAHGLICIFTLRAVTAGHILFQPLFRIDPGQIPGCILAPHGFKQQIVKYRVVLRSLRCDTDTRKLFTVIGRIHHTIHQVIHVAVQSHTSAKVIQHTVHPRCILELFSTGIAAVTPVRCLLRIQIQYEGMFFPSV